MEMDGGKSRCCIKRDRRHKESVEVPMLPEQTHSIRFPFDNFFLPLKGGYSVASWPAERVFCFTR